MVRVKNSCSKTFWSIGIILICRTCRSSSLMWLISFQSSSMLRVRLSTKGCKNKNRSSLTISKILPWRLKVWVKLKMRPRITTRFINYSQVVGKPWEKSIIQSKNVKSTKMASWDSAMTNNRKPIKNMSWLPWDNIKWRYASTLMKAICELKIYIEISCF